MNKSRELKEGDKLLIAGNELTIISKLGIGFFGLVLLVDLNSTGDKKVIKISKAGDLKNEIRAIDRLKGLPGVPTYYIDGSLDYDNSKEYKLKSVDRGPYDYLIMKYIENSTDLAKYTETRKCDYELDEIKVIGRSCFAILKNIHSVGVIHRDLKPDNFIIAEEEDKFNIYLIDYGLSVIFDEKYMGVIEKKDGNLLYRNIYSFRGNENYPTDDLQSMVSILYFFYNKCNLEWLDWHNRNKNYDPDYVQYNKFRINLMESFLSNFYFLAFLISYNEEFSDDEMDIMFNRLSPMLEVNQFLKIAREKVNSSETEFNELMAELTKFYLPNSKLILHTISLFRDPIEDYNGLKEIYDELIKTDINKTIFGYMSDSVRIPPKNKEDLNIIYDNLLIMLDMIE